MYSLHTRCFLFLLISCSKNEELTENEELAENEELTKKEELTENVNFRRAVLFQIALKGFIHSWYGNSRAL